MYNLFQKELILIFGEVPLSKSNQIMIFFIFYVKQYIFLMYIY